MLHQLQVYKSSEVKNLEFYLVLVKTKQFYNHKADENGETASEKHVSSLDVEISEKILLFMN